MVYINSQQVDKHLNTSGLSESPHIKKIADPPEQTQLPATPNAQLKHGKRKKHDTNIIAL